TSQQAREVMYPYFASGMAQNNHQRDVGQIIPRAAFDAQSSPGAGLLVGSPEEVIDKLLAYHELYGLNRAMLQMGFGGVPQKEHLEAIERLGTEGAPVVRREVESRERKAASTPPLPPSNQPPAPPRRARSTRNSRRTRAPRAW